MASASTVMIVVIAITVAVIASAIAVTSTVTTSATAALTAQAVDETLDFVLGCLAALNNLTREAQGLARKWVIEVHLHFVIGDFENTTVESVAILILQWHDGIHKYILVVEMSVDAEHLAVKVKYARRLTVTIRLVLVKFKLEVCSGSQFGHLLLKLFECDSETT